jgi:cobalt-zinc-cadmium efflux system outer membrane protein
MTHLRRRLACLGVLGSALASGCISDRSDLAAVSVQLEQRSGHALASTNNKPGDVVWPKEVNLEDGLSEDEAITLALGNNAAFQEALADLGLSRADLVQAGMLPNPSFSMLVPVGAKPLELTAKYPLEALWLRPRRVAAARLDYERTVQRLVQSGLDLIRDTRLALVDAALAKEKNKLASETLTLNTRLAELSQARMRAGEASELEAGLAESDVRQGREQSMRARRDMELAEERLRHLLGLGLSPWIERINLLPLRAPRPAPALSDVVVSNAVAARPDLRAAAIALEAAGKRIGLARAETFTVAAGINAKEIGSGAAKEFLSGPTFDLAVPIVNQNQGGVAQAKARFAKAARQYFTVRDRAVLEIQDARTRLEQARESHEQWESHILPPLVEAVRQAESVYAAGNVPYQFVLENHRRLADARARAAIARADLGRAEAELERSLAQQWESLPRPTNRPSPPEFKEHTIR